MGRELKSRIQVRRFKDLGRPVQENTSFWKQDTRRRRRVLYEEGQDRVREERNKASKKRYFSEKIFQQRRAHGVPAKKELESSRLN